MSLSYEACGLCLRKVGVIGSGQIGPDIALHLTKVLHAYSVPIEVVDTAADALERGRTRLTDKVAKRVEMGAFSRRMAEAMIAGVTFSQDYDRLAGVDLVIEAATEDAALKARIFAHLESICPTDAILASNSSHLEPEEIFCRLQHPHRAMVIHYFYPAESNALVEIVPGPKTDPERTDTMIAFYEHIGKVPIRVGSRYGYAVDPIFEGLFLAAALCVEADLGSTREVDAVACRALGLRVGPFTAMNLTGGNTITDRGLDEMGKKLGPWFRSPDLLKEAIRCGSRWEVPARSETITLPSDREQRIADALRGAFFGLAGQVVDSGITCVSDLEMALEIGLDITPPFRAMNTVGTRRALSLVQSYAEQHPGFAVADRLIRQVESGQDWEVDVVHRTDIRDVAVVRIRRPRVLNALNAEVYAQLRRHFEAIGKDPNIRAVVLTGFGVKAFVSGADVSFLAEIDSPEKAYETCEASKAVGNLIENLGKTVICALNGFAYGGGLELAMCCSARICRKGLKVFAGQPEVNLGIIPGSGGTQRLPRLVGLEKAAEMLRTGRAISGREAVELALVREEVSGDLIDAAIELARAAADGSVSLPPMSKEPLETPDGLPPVELGHLSRAIDAILCRAILEGCRRPLPEGLRVESEMFAECCRTEDMRIGIENFLANGPRVKARFKHA